MARPDRSTTLSSHPQRRAQTLHVESLAFGQPALVMLELAQQEFERLAALR
jgi:hypothetical protein